jgi:hypothetical protein
MDNYFKYIKYKNKYLLYKYDMIIRKNNIQLGGAYYPIPYRYPFARVKLIPNYISDVEVANNKLKVYYMNGDVKEYQLNTTNINIDKKEIITHLREIFADELKKIDDKIKLLDTLPQVDESINERINAATNSILPAVNERINAATNSILPAVNERINAATNSILPAVNERINAATNSILQKVDDRINANTNNVSQENIQPDVDKLLEDASKQILAQVQEKIDAATGNIIPEIDSRINAATGKILPEIAQNIEAANKKITQVDDKIEIANRRIPQDDTTMNIPSQVEERINEVRRIIEERINMLDAKQNPQINIDEIIDTIKKQIIQELNKNPQINKPSNTDSDIILTDTPELIQDKSIQDKSIQDKSIPLNINKDLKDEVESIKAQLALLKFPEIKKTLDDIKHTYTDVDRTIGTDININILQEINQIRDKLKEVEERIVVKDVLFKNKYLKYKKKYLSRKI